MIPDEAVEAAARVLAPAVWGPHVWQFAAHGEAPTETRNRVQRQALQDARAALEAAAPHMFALLVADLDKWAGRSKSGFYDEAQDDVVQILNPYRSQA